MNSPTIHTAEEIETLLRRCHGYGFADWLQQNITLALADLPQALSTLASTNVWGNSGTLFDLILSPNNGHQSDDFRRDNLRLSELLLTLIDNLSKEGYGRYYFPTCKLALENSRKAFEKAL